MCLTAIQGRYKSKHDVPDVNGNPGPSSYNAHAPMMGKGGLSMGIRHSIYTIPFISDIDVI